MWHKGKSVEQTAKICPDHFSPIATIQGVVLFFYMINFDIIDFFKESLKYENLSSRADQKACPGPTIF